MINTLSVVTLFALFIGACTSEIAKNTDIQNHTETITPNSATLQPPNSTSNPSPTDKATSTITVTATSTFTPSPTQISSPTPTKDVLSIFSGFDIEFSETTSSHLERSYGSFNYRLSKGILEISGITYAKLPEDVLERMYLHAMGRLMYFSRHVDPERYSELFKLTEDLSDDPEEEVWGDKPIFRELAEKLLRDGVVPLNVKPVLTETTWMEEGITADVNNLNMSFVSKEEFNIVLETLKEDDIEFFTYKNPYGVGPDTVVIVFFNGNDIEIISYWMGHEKTSTELEPWDPLETMPPDLDYFYYYAGMIRVYRESLRHVQYNFLNIKDTKITANMPETETIRFSPDDIRCGVVSSAGEELRLCMEKVEAVFTK